MAENVYSVTELVGSSAESVEDAVRNAVGRAGQTLKNLDWFEVCETRGFIENGKVAYYQVAIEIGFRYEKS